MACIMQKLFVAYIRKSRLLRKSENSPPTELHLWLLLLRMLFFADDLAFITFFLRPSIIRTILFIFKSVFRSYHSGYSS